MSRTDSAFLIVTVVENDSVLEIADVRIYSEPSPTLTGAEAHATLLSAPGSSFAQAKADLMEEVKRHASFEPWRTIYERLLDQERR